MSAKELDRATMRFINACPKRRAIYAEHGELYFEAVRWVAEGGKS